MADTTEQKGWKKYWKLANTDGQMSPISGQTNRPSHSGSGAPAEGTGHKNFASNLPDVYMGHSNRIDRYAQYETMDMDSEINACLDILAEFSTQINEQNNTPFEVSFKETPTDNEVEILKKQLQQWVKLNQLDQRAFKLFRNALKYGDQVFIRDPETFELYWTDMTKVMRVIVNECRGKEPEQYVVKDISPNFQNLTVAAKTTADYDMGGATGGAYTTTSTAQSGSQSRFSSAQNEVVVDAKHIVHLSLNEGLDFKWPFGQSILENVFKVYKQKELLEDAILIYRVSRAPERRVFKIDVGNMAPHMAMAFVERVKNEIHQRRIPTANGGSGSIMDASYNPLSIMEDYFFPQTADGRGSSVDILPGGDNLGQIDDLRYFNNKLCRGLRVPSSYLPTGPDDSERGVADGRMGTALIQEFRFNQYCERLQSLIVPKLDDEFKRFLSWRGFNIDSSLFELKFAPPQNFASYRQAELDAARVSNFTTMESLPYISKRFAMMRFLGLTEDEIMENEQQWREEHDESPASELAGSDLRSVGVVPGDIGADLDMGDELAGDLEGGDMGDMGDMGAPGGAPPPPPPAGGAGPSAA